MTVALVVPSLPKYSETFLTNKIQGLLDSGIEVILMVVGVSDKRKMPVPVYYQPILASKGFKRWIYTFWLIIVSLVTHPVRSLRLLKKASKDYRGFGQWRMLAVLSNFLKISPDWIHFSYATMAVERAFIGSVLNAKIGVSFRGYDISIAPLLRPNMYNAVWPYVNKVHSISNDLIKIAHDNGMPNDLPYEIIHPAIDNSKFICQKERTWNSIPHFLTVARLHWKKGIEYTLQALSLLNRDFVYTIIGEGPEKERLVFAAHQLGISEKVFFLGRKPQEEINLHMASHDIYLQYSIQEGFCNAVLEAQSAGMLCVVSDAEGLSENVLNSQTGWVVPRRSAVLLSKQIDEVLETSMKKKAQTSVNAKERVRSLFDIKTQNRYFYNFFN